MADFFRLSAHGVRRRLGVIIASALLGMAVMAVAFLVSERRLILEERSSAVRQAVELAHGIAAHFHGEVTQGRMSDDEGRRRALAAIKALRYSGTEYFWVNDMQPRMVMHAVKPDMDGSDLSEKKDPDGKRLFVEFVNVVKASGAGIVEYQWPKPGSDTPQPKLSYVKGFAPWGWVIGSGVYIDTVNATVLARAIGMGSATAVLGAVLLLIGLWISRSLLRQLGGEPAYAAAVARRMADGDLGVDIALAPGDDSSLLHALRHVRDSLAHIVGRVRDGADSVSTATTEIAHGNLDLSRRTEQQAASLQQTAASMEQLSSTVGRNADNARQANDLVLDASTVAERGSDVVRQVVQNMQGINDSSRRIAEIVGVVDSIAFQTNILALNAAVEAARAGEQGRGFAVVATEVRSLAGRSAQAAKEIKSLIGDSVSRVDQGSALVQSAGTTMNELGTMVRRVTELIGEVTTASDEQRRGVAEASTAVAQMDQVTQQNAALVEESAAAASSLQRQAEQLVQTVGVFKLA